MLAEFQPESCETRQIKQTNKIDQTNQTDEPVASRVLAGRTVGKMGDPAALGWQGSNEGRGAG